VLATALGVFAVALAVRVANVVSLHANAFAYFETPTLDAHFYDAWARRIAAGEWIGSEVFQGVSLYAYFLALVYELLGTGPVPIALVQAVVGALGVALLYLFTRAALSEAAGLLTALFASFYGPVLLYESFRLADGLATFFASAVLLATLGLLRRPGPLRALGTGLVLGLGALARERLLLVAPPLLLLFAWSRRGREATRRTLGSVALVLAGLAAPLGLSLAHNVAAAGDWVLLSSLGGVNFYVGNRPGASGAFDLPPELGASRRELYLGSRLIAEAAEGRELAASEVSAHWLERGLDFWREAPGDALALAGRKLTYFWKGLELTDVVDPDLARRHSAVLSLPLFDFHTVGPLALVGLVVAWTLRRRDPLALGTLVAMLAANVGFMVLFFVSSRFRTSAMPCLFPLAAAAVVWLVERVAARRFLAAGAAAIGLLVAAAFVSADPEFAGATLRTDRAITHFNLGQAHYRDGRYAEAEPELCAALELDGGYAKAMYYLASTLKLTGRRDEALRLFHDALRLDPDFGRGRAFYAALLIELNDPRRAIPELERALELDPELGMAAVGLGIAHQLLGDRAAAVRAFQRAVAIDPTRADDVERRLAALGVATVGD